MSNEKNEKIKIDFSTFVYSLGTSALISMGAIPNPINNQNEVNLLDAEQNIDVLILIEEKTKGNLTPDEEKIIGAVLHEVRAKYVEAKEKEVIKM